MLSTIHKILWWNRLILLASFGLLQLVGVLAVGSVAGYLLLAPTLFFCFLIVGSRRRTFSGQSSFWRAFGLVAGIGLVATSPVLEGLGVTSFSTENMSRFGLAGVGFTILEDHVWLGSGLGTFEPVFKLYENPDGVSRIFANHAHNEYLQWAIETGLPGLLLMAAFLAWWLHRFLKVWSVAKDETFRLKRAAAVATLIVMLHSLVDYPARTPAILAFGALCLSLMVLERRTRPAPSAVEEAGDQPVKVTL